MTKVDIVVGGRISEARRKAGLSPAELAAAVQESEAHLAELEAGHARPSPQLVARLGTVLQIPMKELLAPPE